MIRIGKVLRDSVVDGSGLRVVVFLAGCSHKPKCKECHQKWLWEPDSGGGFTVEEVYQQVINAGYNKPNIALTISGGEPLDSYEELLNLLRMIKTEYPWKDSIWLYTGHTFDEVKKSYPLILEYVDVVIDGKYDKSKKELNFGKYRGSCNQNKWAKDGLIWKMEY
ncbi:MAG: anaerobic ribonucleoside-triphosphate reductase activating protein [Phycisphaerae bacterium]|jgi:anaerobic ribonucleoside-triphosphate reductase activating protein